MLQVTNLCCRYGSLEVVRGVSLHVLGRYSEAIKSYDRALGIDPRDCRVWINKGASLQCRGDYEEAVVCYDRALQLDSRAAIAWRNRGNALLQLERLEEAIRSYDRVLVINPQDSWVKSVKKRTEEESLSRSPFSIRLPRFLNMATQRAALETDPPQGPRRGNA